MNVSTFDTQTVNFDLFNRVISTPGVDDQLFCLADVQFKEVLITPLGTAVNGIRLSFE